MRPTSGSDSRGITQPSTPESDAQKKRKEGKGKERSKSPARDKHTRFTRDEWDKTLPPAGPGSREVGETEDPTLPERKADISNHISDQEHKYSVMLNDENLSMDDNDKEPFIRLKREIDDCKSHAEIDGIINKYSNEDGIEQAILNGIEDKREKAMMNTGKKRPLEVEEGSADEEPPEKRQRFIEEKEEGEISEKNDHTSDSDNDMQISMGSTPDIEVNEKKEAGSSVVEKSSYSDADLPELYENDNNSPEAIKAFVDYAISKIDTLLPAVLFKTELKITQKQYTMGAVEINERKKREDINFYEANYASAVLKSMRSVGIYYETLKQFEQKITV